LLSLGREALFWELSPVYSLLTASNKFFFTLLSLGHAYHLCTHSGWTHCPQLHYQSGLAGKMGFAISDLSETRYWPFVILKWGKTVCLSFPYLRTM
jgi:hypothetical protein